MLDLKLTQILEKYIYTLVFRYSRNIEFSVVAIIVEHVYGPIAIETRRYTYYYDNPLRFLSR